MVSDLIKEVEKRFGKKIENRGDCELLSLLILELLDETVSYNTLRRMFGLMKYSKPNSKTLNLLAQFVGYNGYINFCQNYGFKGKTSLTHILYYHLYFENEAELLDLVRKSKRNNIDFIGFITPMIRELFHEKKYSIINEIFNLEEMCFSRFNYSDLLYLGNSIGLLLRKKRKIDNSLKFNQNFINCVYLTFVDYSSLNFYYGNWATSLLNLNYSDEIVLFNQAILKLKDYLNNKIVKDFNDELIYSTELHPILCSRLLSIKFLQKKEVNINNILEKYYLKHSQKIMVTDYFYELYTTAILTKNLSLMKFLISKINFDIEFYYQKHHLNLNNLMCAFYFRLTNEPSQEKKMFQQFNLTDSRYSYYDFISILSMVYTYSVSSCKIKKSEIKSDYLKLSNKLNYSYFSEDYLLSYFD